MNNDTTIFIVDDDDAVRMSLEAMLGACGYATKIFESGTDFLQCARTDLHGCVLLDVRMPDISGLEVLKILNQEENTLPVIIMTGHGDIQMAVQAMREGAIDFIEKPFTKEIILVGIERALQSIPADGQPNAIDPELIRRVGRLTPREREVLDHLIIGNLNKIIAHELNISPRTVEVHRARVMEKMEAKNLSQLVRMAIAVGLGSPTL
jgi:two-component system, LuxR family, response regulator FixJ